MKFGSEPDFREPEFRGLHPGAIFGSELNFELTRRQRDDATVAR